MFSVQCELAAKLQMQRGVNAFSITHVINKTSVRPEVHSSTVLTSASIRSC